MRRTATIIVFVCILSGGCLGAAKKHEEARPPLWNQKWDLPAGSSGPFALQVDADIVPGDRCKLRLEADVTEQGPGVQFVQVRYHPAPRPPTQYSSASNVPTNTWHAANHSPDDAYRSPWAHKTTVSMDANNHTVRFLWQWVGGGKAPAVSANLTCGYAPGSVNLSVSRDFLLLDGERMRGGAGARYESGCEFHLTVNQLDKIEKTFAQGEVDIFGAAYGAEGKLTITSSARTDSWDFANEPGYFQVLGPGGGYKVEFERSRATAGSVNEDAWFGLVAWQDLARPEDLSTVPAASTPTTESSQDSWPRPPELGAEARPGLQSDAAALC